MPGRRGCGREADWLKSAKLRWQHWRMNRWLTFCGLQCLCVLLSSHRMMTPPHAGRSWWDLVCFAQDPLAICVTAYLKSRNYQIVDPFSAKTKKKAIWILTNTTRTQETLASLTKCPSCPSAGAVQSSIGCLYQNTREAAATAAPSNTSSPSAATTTSGRGRPAARSNRWPPHHSRTHPTEPSASVAQWGRPCRPRGWRGAQSSHAVSAVMADPWTPRGWNPLAVF